MLSKGMNVDAAPSPLPPMTPPLIEAVCTGQRELVELLLDQHASLTARDVAYGKSDIIRLCQRTLVSTQLSMGVLVTYPSWCKSDLKET